MQSFGVHFVPGCCVNDCRILLRGTCRMIAVTCRMFHGREQCRSSSSDPRLLGTFRGAMNSSIGKDSYVEKVMRKALLFLATAALMTGSTLTGSGADGSERGVLSNDLRLTSEQRENSPRFESAQPESALITFIGYSKNAVGETVAKFHDDLSQTDFLLDRKSVEERVKNLKQAGRSADQSQLVLRNWPPGHSAEF